MKRFAPAAERNTQFILDTFGPRLPATGLVLEVASGSGQHAVAFAGAYPELQWQPSDPDPTARQSIDAYRAEAQRTNLRSPLDLDVTRTWPVDRAAAIININMIHISPWSVTEGLMTGAGAVLDPDAPLMLYGPFKRNGQHTAPSNAKFDAWLKESHPAHGVRDLEAVVDAAHAAGLQLDEVVPMPANNFSVIFRRRD